MSEDSPSPARTRGALGQLWRLAVGRPLRLNEASSEEIGSIGGIPALSLDAITSVAYGPEAILVVLGAAGVAQLHLVVPVTIVIVGLLALLVLSYRQVIDGYPGGGGAYAVSRANLGKGVSQVAAASLIVDYTLTVSVSIAAGVGALTSAFPLLAAFTVPLCLAMLALITLLNLRGLGEAARAFLLPTAVFIFGLLGVIVVGLIHPVAPHYVSPGRSLVAQHPVETLGVLLLLKAFASGCSALTGVEAIANGVPVFREPRAKRAKRTELLLGVILGVMLLGLAVLAARFHIGPRTTNTVLSQIMLASVGHGWAYYVVSLAVVAELALAANTSFGGLPILTSLLARDNYAPHFFALRSDRLVYSRGVWVLAGLSGALLVAVGGNTNALIPLFAIGVFTGFTLAQSGMVVHWRRAKPPGWQHRALLNGLGAVLTAIATVVFILTKFTSGGWVVVVAVPLFILGFRRIHHYYHQVAVVLHTDELPPRPSTHQTLVVVPVVGISRLTEVALSDATSLGSKVVAVRVVFPEEDAQAGEIEAQWASWNPGVRLVLLRTPYHSAVRPIVRFVELADPRGGKIIVLIPVVVPRRWYHRLLHNQLDLVLSAALAHEPGILVVRSAFHIEESKTEPV